MNLTKLERWLSVIAVVSIILLGVMHIVSHEETHKEIYRKAGVESYITYGLTSAKTQTIDYVGQDLTNLRLAHAQNEMIGYTIMPFLVVISSLLIINILIIFYSVHVIVDVLRNRNFKEEYEDEDESEK